MKEKHKTLKETIIFNWFKIRGPKKNHNKPAVAVTHFLSIPFRVTSTSICTQVTLPYLLAFAIRYAFHLPLKIFHFHLKIFTIHQAIKPLNTGFCIWSCEVEAIALLTKNLLDGTRSKGDWAYDQREYDPISRI